MQSYFQERGDFHSNQEEQKKMEVRPTDPKRRFNQLTICRPFPIETQPLSPIIVTSFHLVFFLHTLVSYKMMAEDSLFLGIQNQTIWFYINSSKYLCLAFLMALKILIISCITVEIILLTKRQKNQILWSASQKIKKHLRVLIEADYQLASFLLINQSPLIIINFFFSLVIGTFSFIFLENYNCQKDRHYIGSFKFLMVFRICFACGSLVNLICLFLVKNTAFFMFYHSVASIILTYNYIKIGWIIYKDRILRWSLFCFIILYFTIILNLIVYHYSITISASFAIHVCVTFLVITFSLYFRLKKQDFMVIHGEGSIEQEVFVLSYLLQKSQTDVEDRAFLAALLHKHKLMDCKNPKCFTYSEELYDSKRQYTCKSNDYVTERGTLMKFYVQCRYETLLASPTKDYNIMLNYCELLYWKFKNIGQSVFWLENLKRNQHYLSFSSLLKYNGLVDIVRQDSQFFCKNLFNRHLDIEGLIDAQKTYDQIVSNTNIILRQRLETWKMMKYMDIDLSQLRENAESTFHKILLTSQMWKHISKYLKHSIVWKQQYLFFILYVKNEKIKSRHLEQFQAELQKGINLCEFTGNNKSKFQLRTLLSNQTCCMHITLFNSKTLIKRVSHNFTKFTQYTHLEIAKADMSLLLPPSSRVYHEKIIEQLYFSGKFQEQSLYTPKEVIMLNKSGYIVPVFKMFKEFVTNDGELEYACFMKKAEQKDCVILCDEYFEVVGFTQSFAQELNISPTSLNCMKHVNLLSMVPGLIDKTIFTQNAKEQAIGKGRSMKTEDLMINFYYTKDNLEEYLSYYLYEFQSISKDNLGLYLNQVKILEAKIREKQVLFNMDITLNTINNTCCRYYEIRINQMRLKRSVQTFIRNQIEAQTPQEKDKESIISEDCGVFFEKAQATSMTSPANSNIFMKDEINEAPQTNVYLAKLRYIWMMFALLLCAASNIKLAMISQDITHIRQLSIDIQAILKISSKSSTLVNYYQSILLENDSEDYFHPLIESTTMAIEKLINSANIRKVIFDPTINIQAEYFPIIETEDTNSTYDQIDIIYFMESTFHSLAMQSNITTGNRYYRQMLAYFYPAFIQNLNSSKIHLHQSFHIYIDEINMEYTLSFITESILFVVLIVVSFRANYKFRQSMGEMMKIHCQFSPLDIKRILKYYKDTLNLFLTIENNPESVIVRMNTKSMQQQESNEVMNLNKRAKNITFGQKQTSRNIAYLLKTSIGVLILLSFTFFTNIYVNSMVPPIHDLEIDGHNEFMLIPSRIIGANIISTLQLQMQEVIDPSHYELIMENIKILKDIPYQTKPAHNTPYYKSVRDFYFTNVCEINIQRIEKHNLTLDECEKVSESSLTRGLIAFTGYQFQQLDNILNDILDFTQQQVAQFYRSLQYVSIFIDRLISLWSFEFDDLCDDAAFVINALIISSNVLIFSVVSLILFRLLQYLGRQYFFYREFYRNMMPNFIITEQKTIRSKLAIISFL